MNKSFGQYLEGLRGKMSLRDAAEKIGISHTYLRDLELENKTDPSHDTLIKIAKAYGVTYGDLSSKKFLTIDNPKWERKHGPSNKTPIETLRYFEFYDGDGYVLAEYQEEFTILINEYHLEVPKHEFGKILYDEFLNTIESLDSKTFNEIRRRLESIIFEGFRRKADLINILKNEETTFNGHELTDDDRQNILFALESIIEHKSTSDNELVAFLQRNFITYKNTPLTESDCNRIVGMLALLFPDRK